MLILSNARVVLPDRVLERGSVAVDGDRIVDVIEGEFGSVPSGATVLPLDGSTLVPGFIDPHIHGLAGHDVLDGPEVVARVARVLPRYGVTAFNPTSVACTPRRLRAFLEAVRRGRGHVPDGARVLAAHLESNFIEPTCRGAQPAACLRWPPATIEPSGRAPRDRAGVDRTDRGGDEPTGEFTADDIIDEIDRAAADIGVVTLAPELPGALALIGWLTGRGIRVSVGHTAATFDETRVAIAAGATRATHLFNRMPPLHHRAPGAAGALLDAECVTVEVIGDGHHVHPALIRAVVARKGARRTMAVTDATAVAALPPGSPGTLGDHAITAGPDVARLADGTMAGSLVTMDAVFRLMTGAVGLSVVEAAWLCATTTANEQGRDEQGAVEVGRLADLVVLDGDYRVVRTLVGGRVVYAGTGVAAGSSTLPGELE